MTHAYAGRGAVLLLGFLAASSALGQSRLPTVERFTATTASMTPSGVELRIDVREWSDEAARAAVVAALGNESGVSQALAALPTIGYVWISGSGIGYAVKYAHRAATPEGGSVTFVTDRPVGSYESKPWTAGAGASAAELDYSVIELDLENGVGTLSLAAEVQVDAERGLVSLEAAPDAPKVLADAVEQPKPYWVKGRDVIEEG